ncbi:histidinol-phosphatase HisJ [Bacillus sp. EAC]|uniref:histidinol-phosphatase HisJ n=1 Tax=Bacillus sp. EAC TaxID=1978338 RepID=UPI0015C5014B|nr:histidinol-phosphatase HisJ [Bacillus sp. EAC]
MKIDGHTHTQYCPHGSGDHVEQMIEKAIEFGFDEYHITEHSPIPLTFSSQIKPIDALDSIAMSEDEVDLYLKEMYQIRSKYKDRIQIKIGFELDYLPKHTEWTKHFLGEYGQYCDTGILSVHYVEGNDGWHCVDYKAEATLEGIVNDFGHTEKFQLAYYNLVLQSIFDDLGPYKPKRIGHMTLCNKFKQLVHCEETEKIFTIQKDILNSIKQHKYELDYNMAGLFKPLCEEPYPPTHLINYAKSLKIPLIYGSDSHGVEDISRGYDVYLQNV